MAGQKGNATGFATRKSRNRAHRPLRTVTGRSAHATGPERFGKGGRTRTIRKDGPISAAGDLPSAVELERADGVFSRDLRIRMLRHSDTVGLCHLVCLKRGVRMVLFSCSEMTCCRASPVPRGYKPVPAQALRMRCWRNQLPQRCDESARSRCCRPLRSTAAVSRLTRPDGWS